jgi:hypothetical protein
MASWTEVNDRVYAQLINSFPIFKETAKSISVPYSPSMDHILSHMYSVYSVRIIKTFILQARKRGQSYGTRYLRAVSDVTETKPLK